MTTRVTPTPYDAEIALTRGEFKRGSLMAKAEGYRRAIQDTAPLLKKTAAPAMLEALKAWVSASGWSELPNPNDFDNLTSDERRAWVLTKQALDKLGEQHGYS